MNINIIEARIKRNKLKEIAGEYYRDSGSQLINNLKNTGKIVFVGIQREDGIYTVIGRNSVFYSTSAGEFEIPNKEFINLLTSNALRMGKDSDFEFVKTNSNALIWVFNGSTMNAIWNTVMLMNSESGSIS